MRNVLLTIFASAMLCGGVSAQTVQDYFIVGTLNDYHHTRKLEQVDCYYDYEAPLGEYVAILMNKNYGEGMASLKKPEHDIVYFLYSAAGCKAVDSLYFKIHYNSTRWLRLPEKTTLIDALTGEASEFETIDTTYYEDVLFDRLPGEIKSVKVDIPSYKLDGQTFTNEKERLAFMHGMYLRHGHVLNDTLYYILGTHSHEILVFETVARKQGMANVAREFRQGTYSTTMITFSPSPEFLSEIKSTARLKTKLEKRYRQAKHKYTWMRKRLEEWPAPAIIKLAKSAKTDK